MNHKIKKVAAVSASAGLGLGVLGGAVGANVLGNEPTDTVEAEDVTLQSGDAGISEVLSVKKVYEEYVEGEDITVETNVDDIIGDGDTVETDVSYDEVTITHKENVTTENLLAAGDKDVVEIDGEDYVYDNENLYNFVDDSVSNGDVLTVGDYTIEVIDVDDEGSTPIVAFEVSDGEDTEIVTLEQGEDTTVLSSDDDRLYLEVGDDVFVGSTGLLADVYASSVNHDLAEDGHPEDGDFDFDEKDGDNLVFDRTYDETEDGDDLELAEGDNFDGVDGDYQVYIDEVDDESVEETFVGDRTTKTLGGGEVTFEVDEERTVDYTVQDLVDDLDDANPDRNISLGEGDAIIVAR